MNGYLSKRKFLASILLVFAFIILAVFANKVILDNIRYAPVNDSTYGKAGSTHNVSFVIHHSNASAVIKGVNFTWEANDFVATYGYAVTANSTHLACSVYNATWVNCTNTTGGGLNNSIVINITIQNLTMSSAATEANKTLTVHTIDNYTGVISTNNTLFEVDGLAPRVSVASNSANSSANATNLTDTFIALNISVNDTGSLFKNITFHLSYINGTFLNSTTYTSVNTTNYSWINFTGLGTDETTYLINVTSYDLVQNLNASFINWTVTLDRQPPRLAYLGTSDTNNTTYTRNWVLVNLSVNETNFKNITYGLYWQNGTLHSTQTTYTARNATNNSLINFSSLGDGKYTFNVTSHDVANNTNNTLAGRNFTIDTNAPNATLALTKTNIIKGNSVTATCSGNDTQDSSMNLTLTIEKPSGSVANNSANGSSHSVVYSTDVENVGTYTIRCYAIDAAGLVHQSSGTVRVTEDSGTGSGGSGASTSKPEETKSVGIVASVPATVEIKNVDIPVKTIIISSSETGTASVTVKKLNTNPVTGIPSQKTLDYLEITVSNINASAIQSSSIKFSVSKSWVNQNNIDLATIAMYRNVNGQWNKLTTKQIGEDSASYNFETATPGFSYFAIGGEAKRSQATSPEEAAPEVTEEEVQQPQTEEKLPSSVSRSIWIGLALIVLAVGVFAYFSYGKRRK